jgi:hypothetical protein
VPPHSPCFWCPNISLSWIRVGLLFRGPSSTYQCQQNNSGCTLVSAIIFSFRGAAESKYVATFTILQVRSSSLVNKTVFNADFRRPSIVTQPHPPCQLLRSFNQPRSSSPAQNLQPTFEDLSIDDNLTELQRLNRYSRSAIGLQR